MVDVVFSISPNSGHPTRPSTDTVSTSSLPLVHRIRSLMRWTSGRELVETVSVEGRVGFPKLGEMENTTSTIFRLDNGGTAALHMDYLRPETSPSWETTDCGWRERAA